MKMFFDEDKGGFVMQPETVMFASLAFIGIVILLHISNKVLHSLHFFPLRFTCSVSLTYPPYTHIYTHAHIHMRNTVSCGRRGGYGRRGAHAGTVNTLATHSLRVPARRDAAIATRR